MCCVVSVFPSTVSGCAVQSRPVYTALLLTAPQTGTRPGQPLPATAPPATRPQDQFYLAGAGLGGASQHFYQPREHGAGFSLLDIELDRRVLATVHPPSFPHNITCHYGTVNLDVNKNFCDVYIRIRDKSFFPPLLCKHVYKIIISSILFQN